ncbi:M23 family metallopeptidase [Rhizobium ruizarguesonis]
MSEEMERLTGIYAKIGTLGPLGSSALIRRAMSIVAEHINEMAGQEIRPLCDGPREPRPRPGPTGNGKHEARLKFTEAYGEVRSEDRRRTLFADPAEQIVSTLIDFYTGRLDSFEIRKSSAVSSRFIAEAEKVAIETVSQSLPLITVTSIAEPDRNEIIAALRSLAYHLEQTVEGERSSPNEVGLLGREICNLVSVEAGPRSWEDNGRKLIQQVRDVYRCIDEDACCENQAYTKHGEWRTEEVWVDDGNPKHPPPTNPPPFQERPWDNRCQVFPSPVSATVSSDWGWRTINGSTDFHAGMDLAVPVGTQVLNVAEGTIVWINRTAPGGETGVIVRTGQEVRQYWHVDTDSGLSVGDVVRAGGVLGVTANYSSPHLHFSRYSPPGGDWNKKSDSNSLDPCPR